MGICSSNESSTQVVATAKLIMQDGRMMEFTNPVKVGYILQKNPMCFICNSDDMEFDDVVSAISADEELQIGQLYFALPLSSLHHSLKAEEMAALAVKASSAFMRNNGGSGRKFGDSIVFSDSGDRRRSLAVVGSAAGKRGGGGGRRRRKFTAKLSKIEE